MVSEGLAQLLGMLNGAPAGTASHSPKVNEQVFAPVLVRHAAQDVGGLRVGQAVGQCLTLQLLGIKAVEIGLQTRMLQYLAAEFHQLLQFLFIFAEMLKVVLCSSQDGNLSP